MEINCHSPISSGIPQKDKIGRRKVLLICSTLVCFSGIIFLSSANYNFTIIGSGFAGFFSVGLGQYTLPMEIVSADKAGFRIGVYLSALSATQSNQFENPNKRFIVGPGLTAGWAIGAGWYLLSSFIFRDWRYAATMNFSLVPLCLPTYYFFIPESPRIVLE